MACFLKRSLKEREDSIREGDKRRVAKDRARDGGARTDAGGARGYGVVNVRVGRWVAAALGEW